MKVKVKTEIPSSNGNVIKSSTPIDSLVNLSLASVPKQCTQMVSSKNSLTPNHEPTFNSVARISGSDMDLDSGNSSDLDDIHLNKRPRNEPLASDLDINLVSSRLVHGSETRPHSLNPLRDSVDNISSTSVTPDAHSDIEPNNCANNDSIVDISTNSSINNIRLSIEEMKDVKWRFRVVTLAALRTHRKRGVWSLNLEPPDEEEIIHVRGSDRWGDAWHRIIMVANKMRFHSRIWFLAPVTKDHGPAYGHGTLTVVKHKICTFPRHSLHSTYRILSEFAWLEPPLVRPKAKTPVYDVMVVVEQWPQTWFLPKESKLARSIPVFIKIYDPPSKDRKSYSTITDGHTSLPMRICEFVTVGLATIDLRDDISSVYRAIYCLVFGHVPESNFSVPSYNLWLESKVEKVSHVTIDDRLPQDNWSKIDIPWGGVILAAPRIMPSYFHRPIPLDTPWSYRPSRDSSPVSSSRSSTPRRKRRR